MERIPFFNHTIPAVTTEGTVVPELQQEAFMIEGHEYKVGGEVHTPHDITDKSYLLYRETDRGADHFRLVKKDQL